MLVIVSGSAQNLLEVLVPVIRSITLADFNLQPARKRSHFAVDSGSANSLAKQPNMRTQSQ